MSAAVQSLSPLILPPDGTGANIQQRTPTASANSPLFGLEPTSLLSQLINYLAYQGGPLNYRVWGALSCVAGAMERRSFIHNAAGVIYPNLFIMLLARPGVGKSLVVNPIQQLWTDTLLLNVGSQTTTSAAIIDQIKRSRSERTLGGTTYNTSCLLFASSEFGSLTSSYDQTLFSRLSDIYDGRVDYKSETRGGGEIILDAPLVHILIGVQPQFLATMLPETAWQQGFMARFHLIYSEEITELTFEQMFFPTEIIKEKDKLHVEIVRQLKRICHFHGQFTWHPEAAQQLFQWKREGMPPVPTHPRLETYSTRRFIHCCKLCMIIAASSFRLEITLSDFLSAQQILLNSEQNLADIFNSMNQSSEGEKIEQIYHWLITKFAASPAGIPMTMFQNYLGSVVGVPMLERMFNHLQIADVIRINGDKVKPGERNNG